MTDKEMTATERQAAQIQGSTRAYEARASKQRATDAARFDTTSAATRRQVAALKGRKPDTTVLDDVDRRLDAALRARGIDPDDDDE